MRLKKTSFLNTTCHKILISPNKQKLISMLHVPHGPKWYCIGSIRMAWFCTLQGENVLPTLSQVLPPLDETSAQPLYQQLQRALRGAIENGIIGPDDALPPERDLAEMLGVSRITVRKAIDELVEDGLLIRKQGSGTFVSNRVEKNFAKLTSFSEDMRARGREPRSVWLNRAEGTVTPEESLTLRSSPGTPVFRFHRIRYADDAPMALEYATVIASCLTSLETVESSLYEALERTGNRPVRALQRLRAVLLTAEQAKLLKAQEGEAGLLVARVGYLKDGRAVEYSQSYYRGEIYDFVAELSANIVTPTRMFLEAAESADVVAAQLGQNAALLTSLGASLRARPPRAVVTCARGSSDHAATYARYLIEAHTQALTSSAAPSLSSIYDASTDMRDVLFVAISQSGKSPDLLAATQNARAGGALTIALCNTPDSPLMQAVDVPVPLARRAGKKRRGDQVVHRLAELPGAAGRELGAGFWPVGGTGAAARPAGARLEMRLERGRGGAHPCP